MELEEPDDEEERKQWNYTCTSKYCLSPKSDRNNDRNGKVSWVLKRGVNIGKKILVVGLVASSAPIIVPPLVVASAIGIAVSMPYAFFLASHACTENLMSRLLPRPTVTTLQDHNNEFFLDDYEEEGCFQQDVVGMEIEKEEEFIECEGDGGEIGVVGGGEVEHVNNEKDVTLLGSDYGKGVVEEDAEENAEPPMHDDVKLGGEIEDEGTMEGNVVTQMDDDVKLGDEIEDGRMMEEDQISEESNGEEQVSGVHGVMITIEDLDDENGDDDIGGEFKAPFEVTAVSVEEFGDKAIEGDIEEEELQRETKGLLEKIRDEGMNDSGGEFVDESDHEIRPVGENLEVPHDQNQSCITIDGAEGDVRGEEEEEERRAYVEMLESSNDENQDTIFAEVESAEPVSGMLEDKGVNDKNDSPAEMTELCEQLDGGSYQFETIPAEQVGEMVIEEDYNVLVSGDSYEVTREKIDTNIVNTVDPKPVLDEPTVLQEGKLDNISDSVNQESQLHELNETIDLSDADATKIADQSAFDLSDERRSDPGANAYTIDLHEESSNVVVDGHTAPTEVLDSAAEQDPKSSECSSGKDIMCPSAEVALEEESIWKQIHVIRKIIGYEATTQASCADELKALYIFTGVEPPNFLNENSCDLAEINGKLHFLMSIVGVK